MTTDNNTQTTAESFVQQLRPDDVQSVSSNGVSVTLRSAVDKKAGVEADNLTTAQKFNPLNCMFGTSWGRR